VKKTGKGHWAGDRKQTTLWQISGKDQDAATVHGTQKPVEFVRRPILNNSSPGQEVFERFMGSGTTLIAAETTGRVCFGIEMNPAYVEVATERRQQSTGANAVLVETGRIRDSGSVKARAQSAATTPVRSRMEWGSHRKAGWDRIPASRSTVPSEKARRIKMVPSSADNRPIQIGLMARSPPILSSERCNVPGGRGVLPPHKNHVQPTLATVLNAATPSALARR